MTNRRSFLKLLGFSSAAVAVAPAMAHLPVPPTPKIPEPSFNRAEPMALGGEVSKVREHTWEDIQARPSEFELSDIEGSEQLVEALREVHHASSNPHLVTRRGIGLGQINRS